jgi:hypothetical protein
VTCVCLYGDGYFSMPHALARARIGEGSYLSALLLYFYRSDDTASCAMPASVSPFTSDSSCVLTCGCYWQSRMAHRLPLDHTPPPSVDVPTPLSRAQRPLGTPHPPLLEDMVRALVSPSPPLPYFFFCFFQPVPLLPQRRWRRHFSWRPRTAPAAATTAGCINGASTTRWPAATWTHVLARARQRRPSSLPP